MSVQETKKKNYDDILLNLCLTKDDKIKAVLYKIIPVLLNEIFASEGRPERTLIEIVSHCILRCKSFESVDIPLSEIVLNYFQTAEKECKNKILYNSTLSIFLDIGFKNVSDEEKLKFQKTVIENSSKLGCNREMCIFMIIKFIECLEILNDEKNKKMMEEYFSRDISKNGGELNNEIVHFVKFMNEFLAIPIYCINVTEVKFLPEDVIKIYKEKFLNSKNYSVQNHIKMKKNTLYFFSNFLHNNNLTYSSYIICFNEKFDEIKEFANSLLLGKKRFLNFNDNLFICTNFDILKYFDNNVYPVHYVIKILNLFLKSTRVPNDKTYLDMLLSYMYFFFFFFCNDIRNINFWTEYANFQILFSDKKMFVKFLNKNGYKFKLKNDDLKKCLFNLMLFILENTKKDLLNEYIECIFHLIFCYLKLIEVEEAGVVGGGKNNEGGWDDNHDCGLVDISTMIEKFYELHLNSGWINMTVLNRSYILAYSFFDKLKNFKKRKKESYILYNSITKVLSSLEKYFKNCIKINEISLVVTSEDANISVHSLGRYVTTEEVNIEEFVNVDNSFLFKEKELKCEKMENKRNNYENEKNVQKIIVQNVTHLLDHFITFSDNTLLISALLKWSANIFSSGSCEYVYYSLLYQNCSDAVLSDLARDYLNLQKKEKKISFDEYTFFISKKLFQKNDTFVIRLFSNTDTDVYIENVKEEENCEEMELINYTEIMHPNVTFIQNADNAIEYGNVNYAYFNIHRLHNLIKYYEMINFCTFSHVESIYYVLLILDLFFMGIINCENNSKDSSLKDSSLKDSYLKDSYLILYCSVFTLVVRKLSSFLKKIKNEKIYGYSRKSTLDILKSKEMDIYTYFTVLLKTRMELILSNMLDINNHSKLIKKTTKLFGNVYMVGKEIHEDLYDKLENSLISENFEKINETSKGRNRTLCFYIYLFGYIIKKENKIDERYYTIVERITNYLLYTYFNCIKKEKTIEHNELLRYCFKFFYLIFFCKYFIQTWVKIIKESNYTVLVEGREESHFLIHHIVDVLLNVLKYAKMDLNCANISLIKSLLKFISCLPTLKDDSINDMLKEDIRNTLNVENLKIQQLYGHYISYMFLRLDKLYSNKLSYDLLHSIFDPLHNTSKNVNNFLCIIMCYILHYNPFLEYINKNVATIAEFFMDHIKLKNDIYSEYGFWGLSILFFVLSVQSNININDVTTLEKTFLLMKEIKEGREKGEGIFWMAKKTKEIKNEDDLGGKTFFIDDREEFTSTKDISTNSDIEKCIKMKKSIEKEVRNMSCDILEHIEIHLRNIFCVRESNMGIFNHEEWKDETVLDWKMNGFNNLHIKVPDKRDVEKFAEEVYNKFSNLYDDSLYKTYFRKKKKEIDNNFIKEIKKFESRKDYVLNNVYESVSGERNMELIQCYICLSRHCLSYVYLFLFMQYSDLSLYSFDKKIGNFFSLNNEKYDTDLCTYGKSFLFNEKRSNRNVKNFTNRNNVDAPHLAFDSESREVLYSVIDFKKVKKRFYWMMKCIYKELLISTMKSRNDIIKLKIYQYISLKEVSETMKRIENDFLQMNLKIDESDCMLDALNSELTNYIVAKNDLIDSSIVTFLIEVLKEIDLKTFSLKMIPFLEFICTVIESSLMNMKICITFLNTFKSACLKFSAELDIFNREEEGESDRKKSTNGFPQQQRNVNKTELEGDHKLNDGVDTMVICDKGVEVTSYKFHSHECYERNEILENLLLFHRKFEGNIKVELYLTDCINSCLLSSDKLSLDLRKILQFYILNSEKIETSYVDMRLMNEGKCENENYTEKEIFFGKLVKYNNLEKEKEIIEKVISNYKQVEGIEKCIRYILSILLKENNLGKYIMGIVSFVIIKLLERYENLLMDNIYSNVNLCITVFSSISDFISKHICNCYLFHMNELLYYLVHRVPFYCYIKFVNNSLLSDHSEWSYNFRDIKQIRNYSSEVILYLLKKKYLVDLDDENIFRDKKRVDNIALFEDLNVVHNINGCVREFVEGGNFKGKMKEEIYGITLNGDITENADKFDNFLARISDVIGDSNLVDQEIILHLRNNSGVSNSHLEEIIKKRVEKLLTSFSLNEKMGNSARMYEKMTKILTTEIVSMCEREMEKKRLFDEENKIMLKKMESKLIATSFIIKNVKTCENNYYKDIYQILQKRNIFHFYKFFNAYVEEFHIFLGSKFVKDKEACFISIGKFIDSFIDIYKCENYDELETENLHKFLILYCKVRDLFKSSKKEKNRADYYFTILTLLKCFNFMLFVMLKRNENEEKLTNNSCKLHVTENYAVIDDNEMYALFNDILDVLVDVREFEIFQHLYTFVFNIPFIFIRNFNFAKLYRCIVFFKNKYFHNCLEDIANYDSNFCVYFSNLGICLFCYFLIKDDMSSWLHFFNYQYLNKLIKIENLHNFQFEMNKEYHQEDIIKCMHFETNITLLFEKQRIDVVDENDDDDMMSKTCLITRIEEREGKISKGEVYNHITSKDGCEGKRRNVLRGLNGLEINEQVLFSNADENGFFKNLGKFLCLLFEMSKENVNILSVIKTFFQFIFYNKICFYQIGDKSLWEKIYNYIYLGIIKNKAKKVFDHLMDMLNILLCMYNSYAYQNVQDKKIFLEIKINENYRTLFEESTNSNMNTSSPTFLFIIFFKIREKSKLFVFPDYVTQNLRYSIMLNYPHYFL
ncbi:hypothetical protein, conserved [Plasmodium gonderi]|uniref:Uncharacterized protein n=1 Tax=Plasmodium gonderi TaxID=77519 RepID=A0A1Y1JND3_PLAGO|nr:hypothetical protein, conserved [Plasmodium gonderi]GAW81564.1 hypothetical protein, conserved [Plasmodium gonderi]